ncbi:MAG: ABC transporter ATP-binding protein [Sphaerochaetaceae bacterium]|nr:ABC transporter ATP-binding protein [Sphaerochaetaceae bacterium]MDX9809724.1 ABC transporter ATP-binding protein [Sphaerochaetaceae bacterium]
MENVVEFKHIVKRFPGIVANDDISLEVRKGEILAILGENGAGKSTLMSMLFGLYAPDSGEIHIRGKREHISSPLVANALNIGMVHQHFMLVENQTITENIILGVETTKRRLGLFPVIDLETSHETVRRLSKTYQLEVNPTDLIQDVPVSTRQRVEILKMLYRNAEILIFDEPTAVLTPQEIESLLQIIKNLRESGKTIILITHKLEEIKKIADRCAILTKGKLVGVLDVASTTTKEMSALMVGREISSGVIKRKHESKEEVLRVTGLTVVSDERVTLVDHAGFSVHAGEIVAIAGVSGNGQVEIADAIAGLMTISDGRIEIDGKDITHASVRERTEAGISYIPEDRQSVGLVLDFSLKENLCLKQYYQAPYSNSRGILQFDEMDALGNRLIEEFDIRSSSGNDTVVRNMSGGNQQKAIVAREINLNSRLFIFVQPTRGLDVGAIEAIHRRIDELRAQGKAILLVSLELDEIMELADTIIVMYNGNIQTTRKASELTKLQVGEYMMGVHVEKK